MPNLEDWIEAQLKRGYSKKHIKKHLISKGYPHKVVAEVDIIPKSNKNSDKKPNKLNHNFSIIFVILILLAVVVVYIFNNAQDIQIEQPADIQQPAVTSQPVTLIQQNPPQVNVLSGTLLEIGDTAFILDSDGDHETITVPYNLPKEEITVVELMQDGTQESISLEDIESGRIVTIFTYDEDGREIVHSVTVQPNYKFHEFRGTLAEITDENLTLKTDLDVLTIKKLSETRYVLLSNGTSEPISESDLQQNEQAVVIANVNLHTLEMTAISVAVVRR